MAENESLDLGASYSQRWDKPFKAIRRGAPCDEVAAKVRDALYGGVNKARKQFREHGAPLADFIAARGSRPELRQLVRKTEGHHYAQLLESSAHASGPTPEDCLRGWGEAILDRVIDQISHRVAGTENWPTFFDVKEFTDNLRHALADDIARIATKLAQDPNCRLQPKRAEAKGESPGSPTEEISSAGISGTLPQRKTFDPRILGQRIAEARKARGKTQEEVADYLECSRPTYIAIEKGDRAAKSDEIIKLASFLGRKVHELVRPTEPVMDLQPHLRAVAEKMKGADEVALNAAIDELQRLAEDYRDLEKLMNAQMHFNYPPEVTLNPRIDAGELAESVAFQERQRLGLGDQPVIYLRSTLEWDVGLRIFYWDLPSAIAGMYAYTADLGCCILVNRKHPPERRRVSMLHEYGHLIVDRYKPGIDYLTMTGRKPANERFAESFALSFLMPASSVRQRFHDIVTMTGDFQVADLRRLSHFYFVSVEAMALRLEQLGLIQRGSWQFLKESKFAPREAAELLGLESLPINDFPFPERYKYLAVAAYERGEIGDSDLAHYLRCDIVKAREIAAITLSSREVDSTGEQSAWRLDFAKSLLSATP